MSPAVRGIRLPNNEELITSQFADDTTIFFEACDSNFEALQNKLKTFCIISGAKISYSKSTCLGWHEVPPDWSNRFQYQWGGPHLEVRYLGIPFSVDPSLKAMWLWIKDKINSKLNKWHNRSLSLAGRVQVCQKILSSYNIYFSSAWLFNNYQIFEIQKAIRQFLWSDGRGTRKMHAVKWQWCHTDSLLGGLGLKDLRTQGVALAAKWIFHSMEGDSPWKILIRNNIEMGFPKHAKSWKGLPLADLIMGSFPIKVHGSAVFCSIWRAWEQVRKFVNNKDYHDSQTLYGERSIWWNLQLSGKPLALSQGCSARYWNNKGISQLIDLFEHNQLMPWNDLKTKFNIPDSQKKTYNMIVKATKDLPMTCYVDSNRFLQCKWPDGNIFSKIKAKNIYNVINHNSSIIEHINALWYTSLDSCSWKKLLNHLWKGPIEPKIKYFRWLLLLNRLPVRNLEAQTEYCKFCKMPETCRHIFFDCIFARKIWQMFDISYPLDYSILNIVTGHIYGIKKDTNLFWYILSSNILWQLWKCRNEEKYQDKPRSLIEFYRKLTYFKILLQVYTMMMIDKDKLRRFLKTGHTTSFVYEMKHGYEWRKNIDDIKAFDKTLNKMNQEIRRNKNTKKEVLAMPIQENKKVVWMDGDKGWTTWVDAIDGILL
ncbi:uncharacterized protein LOC131070153 [Cryptomeria japonica]|uniref:uncharacterized protein LOC131070153 n=1 Tax=Cryptomeria japonica TaxID=3369 RepID=UPI0027D9FD75|nr:uncharacterized protein LOC131070153 [Cryptomeria japonica]